MSKINFDVISNKVKVFDTDFIDVQRTVEAQKKYVYTNIPCHAVYKNVPNNNPSDVSTSLKQVIQVYYDKQFDIRREDRIVVKKCDIHNNILKAYEGGCGEPTIEMSRGILIMQSFTRLDIKDVIPTPPVNPSNITISYKNEKGELIFNTITKQVELGTTVEIKPETIEGYEPLSVFVDGKKQDTTSFSFETTKKEHNISYVYKVAVTLPTDVRQYVKGGLYTSDDGSLAMGPHLYAPIKILNISGKDGYYTMSLPTLKQEHADQGDPLEITYGKKLRLSDESWVTVSNFPSPENVTTEPYTPSKEEAGAYVTHWYGN